MVSRASFVAGLGKRGSFQQIRIVLGLLGLLVLALAVAIMGWALRRDREQIINDAHLNLQTQSQVAAAYVGRIIDSGASSIRHLEKDRDFQRCLAAKQLDCVAQRLRSVVEGIPQISSLSLIDVQGVQMVNSVSTPSSSLSGTNAGIPSQALVAPPKKRFRNRELLKQVLEADSVQIGPLHSDLATMGRTIPLLRRVTNSQGQVLGVLIAAINIAVVEQYMSTGQATHAANLFLFHQDGSVLMSKPDWNPLKSVAELQFFPEAFKVEETGLSREMFAGEKEVSLAGWTTVTDWPLGVLAASDEQFAIHDWLIASAPAIGVTFAIVLLCVSLLAYLLLQLRRLQKAEDRIAELATRDPVTGLLNRHALMHELDLARQLAQAKQAKLAVLFLDLDRFKNINDSLGHAAGDEVLRQMGLRLQSVAEPDEILSRWGGDEFVILLPQIPHREIAYQRAAAVLALFGQPFEIASGRFATSTSIGVSVFPDDGLDSSSLLRRADLALYEAKAAGRNRCCFYSADLDAHTEDRLALESRLQLALQNQEFRLCYQPQICLQTGAIVGVEALLRWQHPEWGMLEPEQFIKAAEETHLIIPLGLWAVRAACLAASRWQALAAATVTVNLSPLQLRQSNLPEQIQVILEETGLPASRLELEVTESVVVQEISAILGALQALKALGVRLSIDDFGTGHSQLSYLKLFNFDKIQIAREFVRDVLDDANDRAIVRAIVGLGHSLQICVSAKGVSSPAQLEMLREFRANVIQGYLCSEPLAEDALRDLLQQQNNLLETA